MQLFSLLEESPPFVLYYFCRNDFGKHPGIEALAEKSGLSQSTIKRIASAISWKEIKIGNLDRFCHAVGQDFVATGTAGGAVSARKFYYIKPFKRALQFMASGKSRDPMRHLDAGQKRRFAALCRKWKEARARPF